ncbi:hypothetical protein OAH12_01130 [Cyclobacteriaceae bacterium]|nr:hypothetical protein [Cyclobacteriaceae bacterium]
MLSIDNLRKGARYQIVNFGEKINFEVMALRSEGPWVKNLDTLEAFSLVEVVQYGKGKDYLLIDLENYE